MTAEYVMQFFEKYLSPLGYAYLKKLLGPSKHKRTPKPPKCSTYSEGFFWAWRHCKESSEVAAKNPQASFNRATPKPIVFDQHVSTPMTPTVASGFLLELLRPIARNIINHKLIWCLTLVLFTLILLGIWVCIYKFKMRRPIINTLQASRSNPNIYLSISLTLNVSTLIPLLFSVVFMNLQRTLFIYLALISFVLYTISILLFLLCAGLEVYLNKFTTPVSNSV